MLSSLHGYLPGFCLVLCFFVVAELPVILLKFFFKIPFEIMRMMYYMVITLSILPLMMVFSAWYMAILAIFTFLRLFYLALTCKESAETYNHLSVARSNGKFKSSFIIVQLSIALMITLSWGGMGSAGKPLAVVAALVSPVSAAMEFVSRRGHDPISVPISSSLAALSILIIFSSLGV